MRCKQLEMNMCGCHSGNQQVWHWMPRICRNIRNAYVMEKYVMEITDK